LLDPATEKVPVFPKGSATVGARTMLTVAVPPPLSVPRVQPTLPFVTEPQLPGLAVAETKVAPEAGNGLLKFNPVTTSPVFVIV
jgi:hypothetical protein